MEKNSKGVKFSKLRYEYNIYQQFLPLRHWKLFKKKICIKYKFWASFLFIFDVCLVINTRKFQKLFSLIFNTRTSLIQIQQSWQESVLHTFQNSYLRWTCTLFSILHQHCISPRSISAIGPSSLWHILVSRAYIWWNMKKGMYYSLWERQCILSNGEGNTKDTIHFSFLKNMIWIFMLLPNLG